VESMAGYGGIRIQGSYVKNILSALTFVIILQYAVTLRAFDKVVIVPLGGSPQSHGVSELDCGSRAFPVGIDGNWNVICSGTDKTVFVSSALYDGNLGGLVGADAKCNALASAAGLTGNFQAWMSDTALSPSSRFSSPEYYTYKLTDGTVIAYSCADLTDGVIMGVINKDEKKLSHLATDYVWTNTRDDGLAYGSSFSCYNWNSNASNLTGGRGRVGDVNYAWTLSPPANCSTFARIYCFEQ